MANVRTHFILQYYCADISVSEHILVVISYSIQRWPTLNSSYIIIWSNIHSVAIVTVLVIVYKQENYTD